MSSSVSSLSLSDDSHAAAKRDFNALILRISDDLGRGDVDKLRYYYKGDLGSRVRAKRNALKILERLEERGLLSYRHILSLENLLQTINRHDLLSYVQSYATKHPNIATSLDQGELDCIDIIIYKL